jgi:hypothetical protein
MSLSDLAALGSFISGITVLVTIVYSNARVSLTGRFLAYDSGPPQGASVRQSLANSRPVSTRWSVNVGTLRAADHKAVANSRSGLQRTDRWKRRTAFGSVQVRHHCQFRLCVPDRIRRNEIST